MLSEQFLIDIILKRSEIADTSVYPFSLNALKGFNKLRLHPNVTFFIGENGSGKSTLLEAIAVANGFNPEGGTKNFNFSTRESHSELDKYLRCSRGIKKPKDGFFLRAESFFNVATAIEHMDAIPSARPPIIDSYGGESLHEQSHGESFFALLMNRFSANSLFILDEPEAALSPSRQLAMLCRLHDLVSQNCQFLIATHSPILMAYPDSDVLLLSDDGLKSVNFKETEHYTVMKSFINDPDGMLRKLLDEPS